MSTRKMQRSGGPPGDPPGDIPGVPQGLPEPVLLRGDLFSQQLDTLWTQQRRHDGHWQTHRRVWGHLGRGRTSRRTRPQEMDTFIQMCSLTNASVAKKWCTYSGAVGSLISPLSSTWTRTETCVTKAAPPRRCEEATQRHKPAD